MTTSKSALDVRVSSSAVEKYQVPPRQNWLIELENFLPKSVVNNLLDVALSINFEPEGKIRYSFGSTESIPDRLCRLISRSIRKVVNETWPDGFSFGASGNDSIFVKEDSFFIRYYPGSATPPVHMDVSEHEQLGQQIANCIIYMSGPPELQGGSTLLGTAPCVLKLTDYLDDGKQKQTQYPIKVSPGIGKLLIWRSYDDHGILNPLAMHTSEAVKSGVKYAMCVKIRRRNARST
eukprot:CAMPEP_0184478802 /NCGR_PEP_ID=MMETSP0113_2-20130426/729_1 /TAXON_ID=91329 /ORGANISM="Norrisiella sphaerica, Strain BC52" /LENGTH=234 /DNA_ID=CAMNT_0026856709 /DNA_START=381 /DNA_END=1085 /DNA_ORIENTATION=-